MNCPECKSKTRLVHTRPAPEWKDRVRACKGCGLRFVSRETLLRLIPRPGSKPKACKTARDRAYKNMIAAALGLSANAVSDIRRVARSEAKRHGKNVFDVYAKAGVLTPREKALLSADTRPTVTDTA